MHNHEDTDAPSAVPIDGKVWTTPEIVEIRAGEAELGANAIIQEGQFGRGS